MKSRHEFWVGAVALAVASAPVTAWAQAGLSGNALGGQKEERYARDSYFDNRKLNTTSALGQLEQMAGAKVDRSNTNSNTRAQAYQPARKVAPRFNMNQEIKGAMAEALVGALFSSLFNDNSAAQAKAKAEAAAAEAAQAAAEAEAFRVQQELARQARIIQARQYRADWESREAEMSDRLGGVFEVRSGTSYFGIRSNPDADDVAAILGISTAGGPDQGSAGVVDEVSSPEPVDDGAVDLRGSSLVVQPLREGGIVPRRFSSGGAPLPRWSYEMREVPRAARIPRTKSDLEGLAGYFGPWLGKWYGENFAEGTIKATLWGKVKKIRGVEYAKGVYEFNEQRESLTEDVSGMYGEQMDETFGSARTAAYLLGNPTADGAEFANSYSIERQSKRITLKTAELAFGQFTSKFEAPDLEEMSSPTGDGFIEPVSGSRNTRSRHLRLSRLGLGTH